MAAEVAAEDSLEGNNEAIYQRCFVPGCESNSMMMPNKIFVPLPNGAEERNLWMKIAEEEGKKFADMSGTAGQMFPNSEFCCSDHFYINTDFKKSRKCSPTENIIRKLREGVVPHRFQFQERQVNNCDELSAISCKEENVSEENSSPSTSMESQRDIAPDSNFRQELKTKFQNVIHSSKEPTPKSSPAENLSIPHRTFNSKQVSLNPRQLKLFDTLASCYCDTGIPLTKDVMYHVLKTFVKIEKDLMLYQIFCDKSFYLKFDIFLNSNPMFSSRIQSEKNPNVEPSSTNVSELLEQHYQSYVSIVSKLFQNVWYVWNAPECLERIYFLYEYIFNVPIICKSMTDVIVSKKYKVDEWYNYEKATFMACVNAAGFKIPTCVINETKEKSESFKKAEDSLESKYFMLWLEHFVKHKPQGRVLLVLNNNAEKYLRECRPLLLKIVEESEITIHLLPHVGGLDLNPLGHKVFDDFRTSFLTVLGNFCKRFPRRQMMIGAELVDLATAAWDAVSCEAVATSLRVTGLHPLDRLILRRPSESSKCPSQTPEGSSVRVKPSHKTKKSKKNKGSCKATSTSTEASIQDGKMPIFEEVFLPAEQQQVQVKSEPQDEEELRSETLDLGVDTLTFAGIEQVSTCPVKEELEECSAPEVENSQPYTTLEYYPVCDSGEVLIKPDINNQYENKLPPSESLGLIKYYSANTDTNFQPTEQMVPVLYSNYHTDEINNSLENEIQTENVINSNEPDYISSECSQNIPLQVVLSEYSVEDNRKQQFRKQNLKELSKSSPIIFQRIEPKPDSRDVVPASPPVTSHLLKCFECLEAFYTMTGLQGHLTSVHTKDWYICPFCLVEFHHLEIIKHFVTNHKCKECGLEFVAKEYLTFHLQTEHPPIIRKKPTPRPKDKSRISVYECKMCQKQFRKKYLLKNHLEKCGIFSCNHCNQSFSSKVALNTHELKEHLNKNFKCTYGNCKASYVQEKRLMMHLQSQHRIVKRKRKMKKLKLPKQSETGRPLRRVAAIFRRRQAVCRRRQLLCDWCGHAVDSKGKIRAHVRHRHLEQGRHECRRCYEIFSKYQLYLKHRLFHCSQR